MPRPALSSHRGWVKNAAAALAGSAALSGLVTAHRARHTAPYRPVLEHVELALAADAIAPRGLRLGFATDTHIGPFIRAQDVARALQLLLTSRPDLLLLGGDFICDSPRFAEEAAAVLGEAAAAVPLGAVAVLGNHDYACDAHRIVRSLERRGIRVLRNETTRIECDAGALRIVGIDDAVLGTPDVARAFAGAPEGAPAIALWHEPDWAELTAQHGALLQISGHSHGGQVRLPLLGSIAVPTGGRRFVSGLHVAAGMPVYTARGVGVYRPPVRFRCPPEVTLIALE